MILAAFFPVSSVVWPVALCGSPGTPSVASSPSETPSRGAGPLEKRESLPSGTAAIGFRSRFLSPTPRPSTKIIRTRRFIETLYLSFAGQKKTRTAPQPLALIVPP